jgi:hypothetical protein
MVASAQWAEGPREGYGSGFAYLGIAIFVLIFVLCGLLPLLVILWRAWRRRK